MTAATRLLSEFVSGLAYDALPPQVAAAGMLTGSSVVILPAAIWLEGVPTLALQPDSLAAIAYYAVAATALAYLLYYRVLAMAGSGNASTYGSRMIGHSVLRQSEPSPW